MYRQILILALIAAAAIAAPKRPRASNLKRQLDGRIVGGSDADILDYPWQISLQVRGYHNCGGSLISDTFIVTAAHCTDGQTVSSLSVRVNSSIAESGGQVVRVGAIHQNELFDDDTIDFDISIIELEKPLPLGAGIQPIKLPEVNKPIADGTEVTVTGWGTLDEDDWDISYQLQQVKVNIVGEKECELRYGSDLITDRMICAGVPEYNKDSCSGDSGGPLEVDGVLYGIVSWGFGCARRGYPGVYSNVVALRDFITEITEL